MLWYNHGQLNMSPEYEDTIKPSLYITAKANLNLINFDAQLCNKRAEDIVAMISTMSLLSVFRFESIVSFDQMP